MGWWREQQDHALGVAEVSHKHTMPSVKHERRRTESQLAVAAAFGRRCTPGGVDGACVRNERAERPRARDEPFRPVPPRNR